MEFLFRVTERFWEVTTACVQDQVKFTTLNGKGTAVIDFITRDDDDNFRGLEVRTGNAKLSAGQIRLYDAIADGDEVIPWGANAEVIGLEPGVPIDIGSEFDIWDPPVGWERE